jgi:hypothetical protein
VLHPQGESILVEATPVSLTNVMESIAPVMADVLLQQPQSVVTPSSSSRNKRNVNVSTRHPGLDP